MAPAGNPHEDEVRAQSGHVFHACEGRGSWTTGEMQQRPGPRLRAARRRKQSRKQRRKPALIHNESTVVLWKISTDSPGKSQRMRRRGPLLVTLLQARDTGRFLPPRRVYSDHAVDASCLLMMMLSLNLTLFHGAGGNSAGGTGREDREPRPRSLHNCPTAGSCFPLLSLTAARLPSAAGLD